uniref:M1 family aminopeptidase-like n=1 Tax=Dermatophagoides pteronyssinus TaxID=6956 RepID=A0A6P6Y9X9_DERPT|nr:M1 family aminopeptidase-like [Dermatophagoides pteronyssinus]
MLSGLYTSKNLLCTQCESVGFRRITFFIDRPDNLTKITSTLIDSSNSYEVMLSNGNIVEQGTNKEGKKFVTYDDPNPKPCYLFAIIAGPLKSLSLEYEYTEGVAKGKKIDIKIYSEEKYMKQLEWGLQCAKKAFDWDYKYMHRIYDLDRFGIVCIEDFNAGAMENKGLTTYNVSCILAHKDSSTDGRFKHVNSVIGHEYFHNWSGNRVTLRDWFEITLKEGFTNLREQLFSEHCYSETVERISEVNFLKSYQFPEDSSPLAHSIRPETIESVDNLYTVTVYEKGAEVIRMMKTILGDELFVKGTDHYFSKFDGKAVTSEDFREALSEASGIDLSQFHVWYEQKGTPSLEVVKNYYCKEKNAYIIVVKQIVPEQDNEKKMPYPIPIKFNLVGIESKKDLVPKSEEILLLKDFEQEFVIKGINENGVLSFLRDFSAPVSVKDFLSKEEILHLFKYDSNLYQKWEAVQRVFRDEIIRAYKSKAKQVTLEEDTKKCLECLVDTVDDYEYLAMALSLPTVSVLLQYLYDVDPIELDKTCKAVYRAFKKVLHSRMESLFTKLYATCNSAEWNADRESVANRAIMNKALNIIASIDEIDADENPNKIKRLIEYFDNANCYNNKRVLTEMLEQTLSPGVREIAASCQIKL